MSWAGRHDAVARSEDGRRQAAISALTSVGGVLAKLLKQVAWRLLEQRVTRENVLVLLARRLGICPGCLRVA